MMVRTRIQNATADTESHDPVAAAGSECSGYLPTQPVTTGMSDNQKRRWRFAHITAPLIRSVARSRW